MSIYVNLIFVYVCDLWHFMAYDSPTVTIRNPALSCVTACTDFYQAPGPTELVAFHQPSFILAVAVPRFPPPRPAKLAPKLHQDLQKPQQPWFPDNQLSQKLKENAALAEWCPVLTSTNHIIHRSSPTCTSRSTHRPKATATALRAKEGKIHTFLRTQKVRIYWGKVGISRNIIE